MGPWSDIQGVLSASLQGHSQPGVIMAGGLWVGAWETALEH